MQATVISLRSFSTLSGCITHSASAADTLLAEQGFIVSYETIREWCLRFGGVFARSLRADKTTMGIDSVSVPAT